MFASLSEEVVKVFVELSECGPGVSDNQYTVEERSILLQLEAIGLVTLLWSITPAGRQRLNAMIAETGGEQVKCLIPGCVNDGQSSYRGLCVKCYGQAKKAVEGGSVTWEYLEAKGLAAPKQDASPFAKALDQAKKEGS